MFETIRLDTRVQLDGKVHVELPSSLPPESEVHLTISMRSEPRFKDRATWEAHVQSIVGSIPDIERPEIWDTVEIDPL